MSWTRARKQRQTSDDRTKLVVSDRERCCTRSYRFQWYSSSFMALKALVSFDSDEKTVKILIFNTHVGVTPEEILARVNDNFTITCFVDVANGELNFYIDDELAPSGSVTVKKDFNVILSFELNFLLFSCSASTREKSNWRTDSLDRQKKISHAKRIKATLVERWCALTTRSNQLETSNVEPATSRLSLVLSNSQLPSFRSNISFDSR